MSNENQVMESEQTTSLVNVTHYGTIHIGEIDIECVVTEQGERGYVLRQLAETIGYLAERPSSEKIARFLGEIAPNSLDLFNKSARQRVTMPTG